MDPRSQRKALIAAAIVALLAYRDLLIWVPSKVLMASYDAWFFVPIDAYPQVIFVLAGALVFRRRKQLREAMRDRGSPALAALPLLIGASLFVWGQYLDVMSIVLLSFIFTSIGAGLLCFGVRFAKTLLLPSLVLLFAFPIPATLTNQAFAALRIWTATHAAALLPLAGLSVIREGNLIHGSGVLAHVIDTCSGLGFIQVLILTSIFYVAWFPARNLRGALLIAAAPVVAYVFNLTRVCVIVMDPESDLSETHATQGWMVFIGSIVGLLLIDVLLGKWFPNRPNEGSGNETDPAARLGGDAPVASGARVSGGPAAIAVGGLLIAMLAVSLWLPHWAPPEARMKMNTNLPPTIGSWKLDRKLVADYNFMWTVRFQSQVYRQYERDGEVVAVFIGYDDWSDRRRSLISPKNAVPGRGYEIVERRRLKLEAWTPRVNWALARTGSFQFLSVYWYEGTENLLVETLRTILALDQSPFARSEPARVIRMTATLGQTPDALAEAEMRLHDFGAALADVLQ